MKCIPKITLFLVVIFIFGCNASQTKYKADISNLNNTITEQKNTIEELNKKNSTLNDEIEALKKTSPSIVIVKDDKIISSIPDTYDEAVEIMNKLDIQNVILDHLLINDMNYTVVEVQKQTVEVGVDAETVIYDIPDKSGNIILTIPYKNKITATMIAIIEEPSKPDWGSNDEHWVKIQMENGMIGWVRGEYVETNRGGIKYLTQKNIWLEENYASHWR